MWLSKPAIGLSVGAFTTLKGYQNFWYGYQNFEGVIRIYYGYQFELFMGLSELWIVLKLLLKL